MVEYDSLPVALAEAQALSIAATETEPRLGLTYANRRFWRVATPSLDDKDTPSLPQRTVEEYTRDKELGINSLPHWKPPVYGQKVGKQSNVAD